MDEEARTKALKRTLKLLGIRAHSVQEIRTKLYQKGFQTPEISYAISECLRLNFLNDNTFAELYVNELKNRGWGGLRIKNALRKKGVSREIIDALTCGHDGEAVINPEDELERAKDVLKRKMPSLKRETDKMKRRAKAFRYLASRGFSQDTVYKAIAYCFNSADF